MNHYSWSVVGAGPAGIAAVGMLLDAGISHHEIAWIDPSFTVGDLGSKWYRVEGNTKVKTFIDFLNKCDSFNYSQAPDFAIDAFDVEKSCKLGFIVEPLQWISDHLTKKVQTFSDSVHALSLHNQYWNIELEKTKILSKQVTLATGCVPNILSYPIEEIPIEIALNDELLVEENIENETVAVFGASHSAIVALKNLMDCKPNKIINFYKHPVKYAVYFDDFTLFDNTGLKGNAAVWAKEYIDGIHPACLERVHCDSDKMQEKLAECTRAVYAIGFQQNSSIAIRPYPRNPSHNDTNGIIAPGLFGLGIAYPNQVIDPLGNVEHNVGVWKFMQHLIKCLPIWMKYHA